MWRYKEVARMLRKLKLRHPEKTAKRNIALKLPFRPSKRQRSEVIEEWDALREEIERGVAYYIDKALMLIETKRTDKQNRQARVL